MGYTRSKNPPAYSGSFQPGAYKFLISRAEMSETKGGREQISLDFQLYNMEDGSKGKEIKFFNMITEESEAMKILDSIMYAVNLESYQNINELQGKDGIMLVG